MFDTKLERELQNSKAQRLLNEITRNLKMKEIDSMI